MRFNKMISVLTLIYLGVILMILPFFDLKIYGFSYEIGASFGLVFVLAGVAFYFYNKLSLQIAKIFESIVRVDKEGFREFNLIQLPDLFENIGRYNHSGKITMIIDYQYVNRSIVELFENFQSVNRLREIRILLTNYNELLTKNISPDDSQTFEKRILIDLLKEISLRDQIKVSMRVTNNTIFPLVFITDERISLLVPYDARSRKFVNITTDYYSEIGDRYRFTFDKHWAKSIEFDEIRG